jgi:hypothetical protein
MGGQEMIQEAYCSFEIAKLLKEKGFDERCRSYFINDLGDYRRCAVEITDKDCTIEQTLRPTHQMACAWLRINHQIFIRPNIIFAAHPIKYYCEIFCYGDNLNTQQDVTTESFETPEEAVEAALKYVLKNLI